VQEREMQIAQIASGLAHDPQLIQSVASGDSHAALAQAVKVKNEDDLDYGH
jgi:hypothetical protein